MQDWGGHYLGRGIGLDCRDQKRQAWALSTISTISRQEQHWWQSMRKDPQKLVASLYLLGKDWLCNSRPIFSISFRPHLLV